MTAKKPTNPKLCGHFNTYWSTVYTNEGSFEIKYCSDCQNAIEKKKMGIIYLTSR